MTFPFRPFSILRPRCDYERHYSSARSLCSLLGSKFLVGAMNSWSSCCMLAREPAYAIDQRSSRSSSVLPGNNFLVATMEETNAIPDYGLCQ